MTLASLAFMTGLAISLEAMLLVSVLGSLCLMLIVANRRVVIAKVVLIGAMVGFGVLWASGFIKHQAPEALAFDSVKLDVIGYIDGLIDDDGKSARFVLNSIDPPGHRFKLHWRYPAQSLNENALVNLQVKVKQAHSLGVLGAWDYEGWLYQQGIRYSGYVIKGQLIDAQQEQQSLRSQIRNTVRRSLEDSTGRALLLALLMGDAERGVEQQLNLSLLKSAPITVVVAGHHGSNSSSSAEFIGAVQTDEAWFSAGYLNRYQFPKKAVLSRWQSEGVLTYRTDLQGAIQRSFKAQPSQTSTYWPNARKPWHNSVSPLATPRHAVSSVSE